jgi:glycosyltransferase involved in cell wall biosynthesis
MRIAYITAGAAGMYCGSCLHDNTLAAALIDLGEEVVLVPTYTPLRTDEQDVSIDRVFFGGINVYLQQKSAIFRHTPWWLDRLLDHPALLESLSRRAGSVDPKQLGALTISMLCGEQGKQRKELEKLVHWLIQEVKPEIVHLSNSMQIGMARMLRARSGPPVVCQLSGEDIFLEKLPQPHYDEARSILRERAADVDAFIALNNYYAEFMADYLAVDRSRIHVISHGLNLDGHGARKEKQPQDPRVIGYLARICEDKGLHLLVEACELLAARDDLPPFVVRAAGYLGESDKSYLAAVEARTAAGKLARRFEYLGELTRAEKIAFLQSLDIFSTPTVYRESKGLPALEAMANAVPVVLPAHGGFPELIADTGGGLLHEPRDAADLAAKLAKLLLNPRQAREHGLAGQQAIHARYHAAQMAQKTLDLYRRLVATADLASESQPTRIQGSSDSHLFDVQVSHAPLSKQTPNSS